MSNRPWIVALLFLSACGSNTNSEGAGPKASSDPLRDAGVAVSTSSTVLSSTIAGPVTGSVNGVPVEALGFSGPDQGLITITAMSTDFFQVTSGAQAAAFGCALRFVNSLPKTGTFTQDDTGLCGQITAAFSNADGSNGNYVSSNATTSGCPSSVARVGSWTLTISSAQALPAEIAQGHYVLHGTLDASLPGKFLDMNYHETPGTVSAHLEF